MKKIIALLSVAVMLVSSVLVVNAAPANDTTKTNDGCDIKGGKIVSFDGKKGVTEDGSEIVLVDTDNDIINGNEFVFDGSMDEDIISVIDKIVDTKEKNDTKDGKIISYNRQKGFRKGGSSFITVDIHSNIFDDIRIVFENSVDEDVIPVADKIANTIASMDTKYGKTDIAKDGSNLSVEDMFKESPDLPNGIIILSGE